MKINWDLCKKKKFLFFAIIPEVSSTLWALLGILPTEVNLLNVIFGLYPSHNDVLHTSGWLTESNTQISSEIWFYMFDRKMKVTHVVTSLTIWLSNWDEGRRNWGGGRQKDPDKKKNIRKKKWGGGGGGNESQLLVHLHYGSFHFLSVTETSQTSGSIYWHEHTNKDEHTDI